MRKLCNVFALFDKIGRNEGRYLIYNTRSGFYGLFRLLGMVGISVNGLILLIDAYIIYVIAQRELRIVGYATIASDGKIE